jgi:nucleoside-diphosphate-sugar epimerase
MKLLLTGATGFIGGAVAVDLHQKGLLSETIFMVRASNPTDGLSRLLANLAVFNCKPKAKELSEAQIICADLSDVASLTQAYWGGVTHVIHCAALATFSNNPKIWAMNVDGTLALAKAVHQQGDLKRWIQVGTAMSCGPGLDSPVRESWELGLDDAAHLVPYTRSKIAVEVALHDLPNFPLVVARPSIVVGHSQLGCSPSSSIFWVFRMAIALERFTCATAERIDIIPADWCAQMLSELCLKPQLKHDLYHVSAGQASSNCFSEIDSAFADAQGTKPISDRYKQVAVEDLRSLVPLFEEKLGKVNRILILRALTLYGAFAKLNYVFDNNRLLQEGFARAPSFASYIKACVETSQHIPMTEQMAHDFK